MKLVGELDAGNRHVQFDERGRETECWPSAPSHRARPRLYRSGSYGMSAVTSADGAKQTRFAIMSFATRDPERTRV